MSTDTFLLPKEVVALIQHIELNKSGWWEKTIERLVMSSIWLADHPLQFEEITESLLKTFKLNISQQKLESAISALIAKNNLLCTQDGGHKIPDARKREFEAELNESDNVELKAKETFIGISRSQCPELDAEKMWELFDSDLLGPVIKKIGANAYHLLSGNKLSIEGESFSGFLGKFPSEFHDRIKQITATYLDPKNDAARSHVGRILHARFCIDASGLPEEVIGKLNASVGKHIKFTLFVDTNFLFSLLDLHENPANPAAQELRQIINKLNGNPKIDLYVCPDTIDEAKTAISASKSQLTGFPNGRIYSEIGIQLGLSGMACKYLVEREKGTTRTSIDAWFDPYLKDFVAISRGRGVELFNEKNDEYSTRQDVIDDITDVLSYEEKLAPHRRKSYQKVRHDMVLWHYVNDKRPKYIESPIEATYWILTIDNRLIAFDEHKKRRDSAKIPLCIHPTSLIQLLQFWIPRSKDFEEALLGSLRMPFIFQGFDVEGEKTSLKILKGIGKFDGSDSLPRDTITRVMLNEGLRSRLEASVNEDEEIKLIKDALVESIRERADAEERRANVAIEEAKKSALILDEVKRGKMELESKLNNELSASASAHEAAINRIKQQDEEIKSIKENLLAIQQAKMEYAEREREAMSRKKSTLHFYAFVFIAAIVSCAAGYAILRINPSISRYFGYWFPLCSVSFTLLFAIVYLERWILGGFTASLKYKSVARLYLILKWMFIFLYGTIFVGVGLNLLSNTIQKNMDQDTSITK